MDMTLCTSEVCKMKNECKRYHKNCDSINVYWQAYSDFTELIPWYFESDSLTTLVMSSKCEMFIDLKENK